MVIRIKPETNCNASKEGWRGRKNKGEKIMPTHTEKVYFLIWSV